ncbi:MAG TPA: N-acetylmuramidase family protein [Caldimonas sp.]|jgi:hypothetical protein|nr:N-acetylmuramidase family protein [Caldimonas sp.]
MAGYRIPGPVCGAEQPWSLRDGTLALWRLPAPGPICVTSPTFRAGAPLVADADIDLSFLFRSCLNPVRGISDAAWAQAAAALDVDIAAIKAVADVETPGRAFDTLGRPLILFERHYFSRLTSARFDLDHARVSAKRSGGYTRAAEYGRLEEAYALDADAALRSASWGRFQIMGDNFIAAGFTSAPELVKAMTRSEEAQLMAFVHFVRSDEAMANALHKHDWAGFARRYNGKGYKKNLYDTKLTDAYARFSGADKGGTAGKGPAAIAKPLSLRKP